MDAGLKPTPTANTADLTKPGGWQQAVLAKIGAPHDPGSVQGQVNISFLDAWAKAEGTKARFNPLATSWSEPGATNFNSVGVKDYASPQDGVDAMAATLLGGYPTIVSALRKGDPSPLLSTPGGRAEFNKYVTGTLTAPADGSNVASYITNIAKGFFGETGAADWTSFDLGDAAHAATAAAGGALDSLAAPFTAIAALLGSLFNLATWRRVGLLVGGGVLMLGGLYLIASRTGGLPAPVAAIAAAG